MVSWASVLWWVESLTQQQAALAGGDAEVAVLDQGVPECLMCSQLQFSVCCILVLPASACQSFPAQLLWLSHCPFPFSLGHKTTFSSMERLYWCCFMSAFCPETFVRASKNLLWRICASRTLEKRFPSLFFFHSVSSKMKFWELFVEYNFCQYLLCFQGT